MSLTYNEITRGNKSESRSRKSIDKGVSQRLYDVEITSAEQLVQMSREVLGYTSYAVSGDGKLNRVPPFADPVDVNYFAETIDNCIGIGKATQTSSNPQIEVPTIGDFALYPRYEVAVSFTPRQYPIIPDSEIQIIDGFWYPDINTDSSSAEQGFTYPNEWTRYTEATPLRGTGEYLTQQGGLNGTMVFENISGQSTSKTASFMPSIRIPNYNVSLIWRAVPVRYILSPNSYIANKNWQNRVNQNPIHMPFNGPGDVCPPGSLLYVDYSYTPYTPPTGFEANTYGNGLSAEKLCDIVLSFIYTNRTTKDSTPTITNNNYVAAGHNLFAWHGDLLYHYGNLKTTFGDKRPCYLSCPIELMQCDPDSSQPNPIG